jgi:hypothetical protein
MAQPWCSGEAALVAEPTGCGLKDEGCQVGRVPSIGAGAAGKIADGRCRCRGVGGCHVWYASADRASCCSLNPALGPPFCMEAFKITSTLASAVSKVPAMLLREVELLPRWRAGAAEGINIAVHHAGWAYMGVGSTTCPLSCLPAGSHLVAVLLVSGSPVLTGCHTD